MELAEQNEMTASFRITAAEQAWIDCLRRAVWSGRAMDHCGDDVLAIARVMARSGVPVPDISTPSNGHGGPLAYPHPKDASNWSA